MIRIHAFVFASLLLATSSIQADALKSGEKLPARADFKPPSPDDVARIEVEPKAVRLVGEDESRFLLVTGTLSSGILQDLSGDAKFQVENGSIAKITGAGRVIPISNGKTNIVIRYGQHQVTVPLTVEATDVAMPINFANHVVPIFTKLGCNGGGCHGKSGGQNGFALSLLGFTPEFDYQALVKENRGRRLLPSNPDYSLLLRKAIGAVAHAGGARMETDSDEYKIVRRWIGSGMPVGEETDPVVVKITASPARRIIGRQNRQQVTVLAHYSDGKVADVTTRAQFESNDTDIAIVDGAGLVRTLDLSGEAAVMARYQGHVATFVATVPLGKTVPSFDFPANTVVDRHTSAKWKELGIVPSELSLDDQFIRRVSIDITGTLPTPEEVERFRKDSDPKKREKLIDALLETPEYSYYFANKWADVLRVKRGNQPGRAFGTFAFHGWIRESIAADKPYDRMVREILGAIGDEQKSPPTMWYRDLQKPEQFVDDTAQLFLGVRIACAQCHHHPYEKWSQDDYWGMAAFFGQIGRKNLPVPGLQAQNQQNTRVVIYNKGTGAVTNTRTKKPAVMRALDADAVELSPGEDPRGRLADWMVDAKNPFFARAVANRYWAHFFGKGIVDPVDDMRVTNPPSNPELLDALAKDLIDSGYSLKHLIKTIVKSRTYQLASAPNEWNKSDKKSFARFYPRRMPAEVLYDAVSQVTGAPPKFNGLPTDKFSPNRAIMLPDESFQSYFLDVFGRPQRISACECERVTEANLAQALHLLNSNEVQNKLSAATARAATLAKDSRRDEVKVRELFLWAFARDPNQAQIDVALRNIAANSKNKQAAYENVIWALINAKEFVLVQ